MPTRTQKPASGVPEPSLFDPKGTVAFPRRFEVLGSIHGNQIIGLAHATYSARVQLAPVSVRSISGFIAHQPDAPPVFLSPRKTSVQASVSFTLLIPDFTKA